MHWDYVITSFEPINFVTGGIGTYTRCILNEFCTNKLLKNKSVLFLTPHVVDPDWLAARNTDNIMIVLVDFSKKFGGNEINYVGDEHSYFSFKVADYLETKYRSGDTFGLIEFSDYGRDGYYFLKKKRLGTIRCKGAYIRLHSPDMMLYHDNCQSLVDMDLMTRYKIEQEIYCYRHCDGVLYGGDEMLSRIEREVLSYDLSIASKAIKIPHPFIQLSETKSITSDNNAQLSSDHPLANIFLDNTNVRILYTGRLERRKGVYDLIKTILESEELCNYIETNRIYIIFCGKDTNTAPGGRSMADAIGDLIDKHKIAKFMIFTGYMNQNTLYKSVLPHVDGFIFPSLFENYPNVLIESFPHGKPTLVSSRGCMPELSKDFAFVSTYDPFAQDAKQLIRHFISSVRNTRRNGDLKIVSSVSKKNLKYRARLPGIFSSSLRKSITSTFSTDSLKSFETYTMLAERHNANVAQLYLECIESQVDQLDRSKKFYTVSFVVPHFKNTDYLHSCIQSIYKCKKEGDEIIVVDDCSPELDQMKFKEICRTYGVTNVILEKNQGPSVARNVGASRAGCDLIQFVDSDDLIDRKGFEKARSALEMNEDIDFIYGITHTFGATEHLWMPRDCSLNGLEENYTHSAILIKREVFAATGGFDENLRVHYEDWEFNTRLALMNILGEAIPYITLHYRQKPGSRNISNSIRLLESRKLVIERSISNAALNGGIDFRHSNLIHKLGLYFHSWTMAALWIKEQDKTICNLKVEASLFTPPSSQISQDRFVLPSAASYPTAVNKNLKMHVYEKSMKMEYNKLVAEINYKVSEMSAESRMEFLKSSSLFDADWYIMNNADLKKANVDPYEHYENFGWREGRNPNKFLDASEIENLIGQTVSSYNCANKLILFEMLIS